MAITETEKCYFFCLYLTWIFFRGNFISWQLLALFEKLVYKILHRDLFTKYFTVDFF